MSVFIIKNLYKSYKDNVVLKDINLVFPNKGLISIVGKSGSGKSTLLNIMMGIEKPTKGKVLFNYNNIAKFSDKKFSDYHLSDVSLIFQHYNLFDDLTALENVLIPLEMKGIRGKSALDKALPYFKEFGISELIHKKINNLSGGEKQRIAIIRAIVIEPKVLLCDEPTGALDYSNGISIMNILKKLSEKMLVVMVSHNQELVNKYSDQIIELKDGEIVSNEIIKNNEQKDDLNYSYFDYKNTWVKKFIKLDFHKNFKKNIFSFFGCLFCFISIFICIGFSYGSKESQNEALRKNLSLCFSTISETEFVEIKGSPLTFQKSKRPTLEDVDKALPNLKSVHVEENISYFISTFTTCSFNKVLIPSYQMIPLYDSSLDLFGKNLLIKGGPIQNNFEEIIINEEFESILKEEEIIGKELILSGSSAVNYPTGNVEDPFVKDVFNYTKKFRVAGVVKEFSFLNQPKIFYSYIGAREFLKNEKMDNLSIYLNKPISYYSFLEKCDPDNVITSYSYYLFLDDPNECDSLFKNIKNFDVQNSIIQISNSAYEISSTYSTFIGSFSSALIVLCVVSYLGLNFILGMISLSTYIECKKRTAILTCLGARNKTIYDLFLSENYLLIICSIFTSFLVSPIFQKIVNLFLERRFNLTNLVNIPFLNFGGINCGLQLFSIFLSMLVSTIFTLTPMIIYRNKFLSDELRDE